MKAHTLPLTGNLLVESEVPMFGRFSSLPLTNFYGSETIQRDHNTERKTFLGVEVTTPNIRAWSC